MICKKCGFEYVDGLKECPNCQAPNESLNTKILTPEQKNSFKGITINETLEDDDSDVKESNYTKNEYDPKFNRTKSKTWSNVKFKSSGMPSLTFIILGLFVLGMLFFIGILIVPILLIIAAISLVYFLISSL
jgi:predicted ATP-dependent serine protease